MNITMEELQRKLELWKDAWPKSVYSALKTGTDILKTEIARRYNTRRSEKGGKHLADGVETSVKLNPLVAHVEIEARQRYKAWPNEFGATITPKRGRYLAVPTGGRWDWSAGFPKTMNAKWAMTRTKIGRYSGKTGGKRWNLNPGAGQDMRKVKSVTINPQPVFKPVLEQKHQGILNLIRDTIYSAYDKGVL